jgi:septum formation protein
VREISILRYFAATMRSLLKQSLEGRKIILASKSPRRQELLKGLEIDFEIRVKEVDESFDPSLKGAEVARFLARMKASAFLSSLNEDEILITSDTTVCLGDEILNKPADRDEAVSMLSKLSGQTHSVVSAVALTSTSKQVIFHDETSVHFRELTLEEIEHYVDHYRPFDKAGSYGIQDFIGFIGVDKMSGSYYTVMGLPLHLLYQELSGF